MRIAYTDDHSKLTATLEYRRDGEWEDSATHDARGRRIAITRDGEPLLETPLTAGQVERYGESLVSVARRLVHRSETTEPESWPVTVTQPDGSVVEALRPPAQATFEVYEDHGGEWRWRLVHRNGNIIADGGEGYSSKRAAKKGVESVKRNALGAPIDES